jgi:methyl-accepting chemotaxis protein
MTEPTGAALHDALPRASRRKLRNYLLYPRIQLRLAGYLAAVAGALSLALGVLLWRAYREASELVALGDPRADEVVAAMLAHEDRVRLMWIGAILAAVVLALVALGVVVTHRIAGPALALARMCRAIASGSLARPRSLRRGDLLVGLADDLAAMVDALRTREEEERTHLTEAIRMLGEEGGASRARTLLATVAAAKATRIGDVDLA